MNLKSICILSLVFFIFICFNACKSSQKNNIKDNLKDISKIRTAKKYKHEDFIVPHNRYTTTIGLAIHKLYYQDLIDFVEDFVLLKKYQLHKASVGFYYDRKSKILDKLYFGFDCDLNENVVGDNYGKRAWKVLFDNVKVILLKYNKYLEKFFENIDIYGIVLTFYWKESNYGIGEGVVIWINKGDIELFMKNKILYPELLTRAMTTNLSGKTINLLMFH